MAVRVLLVLIVLFIPSLSLSAAERLFDLDAVSYFEDCGFTFIQTFLKESDHPRSRRGGFMPMEGVVEISFKSRKNGTYYEMITESYQNGRLLYSTEAVVDRFGITIRYAMYEDGTDLVYDYRYDSESGTGSVDYLDEEDERVRKRVTVPPQAYSMMTIPYIIGALAISDSERHSLGAVVGDGKKLGLYLQRVGTVTVQVRERFYTCSKVELGFSGVIGLLVPKMVFYVDDGLKLPVRQDMMGGSIIEYKPVD
jgi:hypothetical protein